MYSLPGRSFGSHRILPDRYGKDTGSCRKTWEKAETWKQYSGRRAREVARIYRKNPGWNTASNFPVFSVAFRPFPAVRCSPGLLSYSVLYRSDSKFLPQYLHTAIAFHKTLFSLNSDRFNKD